jgi:branched-chain amino acid transport system substrate-binding protein
MGGRSSIPGPYENMSQDFTTQIDAFKDAGVEIVVCFPFPPDFPVFWRQAAQRGLAAAAEDHADGQGGPFRTEMEALGDLGQGLCTGVYWHPAFPFASAVRAEQRRSGQGYEAATGAQWAQALGRVGLAV